MKRIVIGITGASGSVLAKGVIEALLIGGHEVHLVVSPMGQKVLPYELETDFETFIEDLKALSSKLILHPIEDLFASISSGSFHTDGMIIVPCSMGTLGKIAGGISDNLLCRAADVTLKEQRPLILVARETPLSSLHLENMLKLSRNGAVILPPVPAFYNRPKDLQTLIDHSVGRILKSAKIENPLYEVWQGGHLL